MSERTGIKIYGISLLSIAVALLVMLLLDPWIGMTHSPFLFFFSAVMVSAWYGGARGGTFATLLSALLANYFFLVPPYTLSIDPSSLSRTFLFVVQGIAIGLICGSLRAANQRAKNNLLQLQVNEAKIGRLVESDVIGIFSCHLNGSIVEANERFLRMTGYTREEVRSGRVRWDEITPREFEHRDETALEELTFKGKNTPYEKTFIGKDGRRVPVIVGSTLLDDRSNEAIAFVLDLSEQKRAEQRLSLQYAVARILAEATAIDEALPALLQTLCETLGWQLGIVWRVDSQSRLLQHGARWQVPNPKIEEFALSNEQTNFAPKEGLPGQVWSSGKPVWRSNLAVAKDFPKAEIVLQTGLLSVFGFPILLEKQVLGVIECFADKVREPDDDSIAMMAAIGSQIGQFMERIRTINALQESQELFSYFMNNSPGAAYIKDEMGRHVYVNSFVENKFSRKLADWLGKTDFDLFPPRIARQWRENDLKILTSNQPLKVVETLQREDGFQEYVMSFKFPFQDRSGRKLVGGISLDITEQIHTQAALKESSERLSLALAAAKMGDWGWDSATDMVTLSEPAGKMFGIPHDASATWTQIRALLHPEDRERAQKAVEQAIAENDYYEIEYRVNRPSDGMQRWISARGLPRYTPSGQVLGMLGVVQDVTERKNSEEALRQSEERLRVSLKNSPVTVFNQDTELRYTWEYDPTRGNAVKEILGKKDRDLYSPEDAEVLTRIKIAVIATGIGTRQEVKITKDDEDFYYDLTVEPLQDDRNCIVGVTCAAVDITDRKRTELKLKESQRFIERIADATPGIIYIYDLIEQRNVYVNRQIAELLGYEPARIQEMGDRFVPLLMHPDDIENLSAHFEKFDRARDGEVIEWEYRMRGTDGEWRWFWSRDIIFTRTADGSPRQILGNAHDITNRKKTENALRQSEDRLNVALKSVPITLFNQDRDLCYTWIYNPALGYKNDEVIGKSDRDLFGKDDAALLTQIKRRVLETGSGTRQEVKIGTAPQESYFDLIVDPLFCEQNRIIGVTSAAVDITDRKRAEQERERLLASERAARAEAEAANRIKDEFLAVLSHELRSPLNPILGWTKLLQSRKLDEKGTEKALETIERNAKLQTQLIEDLLDISRILRGKIILNFQSVNLSEIIAAALETVFLSAIAKGIQIETHLPLGEQLICADPNRLQQIIWNLLSNGVKFTPTGGRIEVHLEWLDDRARITVKDNGKGISPDFLPYVFDSFTQADSSITRKFGGLGLGLAIVRHFTELHGGTVKAESQGEGRGATFTVELPRIVVPAVESPLKEPRADALTLKDLRVLVVDDEVDMRDLMAIVLEKYEASVRVAASAAEALSVLDEFKPDILIADIGMPEVDGYALMRQIRARSPQKGGQIPAIALSAFSGEYDRKQALAAGFQMHISKPVEPSRLVEAISRAIG